MVPVQQMPPIEWHVKQGQAGIIYLLIRAYNNQITPEICKTINHSANIVQTNDSNAWDTGQKDILGWLVYCLPHSRRFVRIQ